MAPAGKTDTLIARRYAGALIDLAEGPSLDAVARDCAALGAMLAESAGLRRAVESPVVPRAAKLRAIEALAEAAGFHDLTRRFLGVVAENNRLAAIGAIAAAFLGEVAARRGLQEVEIVIARPLDDARRAALEHALNHALAAKTSLSVRVDPALIGGLVIRAGSRLIDASVRTRLGKLGRILKTAA